MVFKTGIVLVLVLFSFLKYISLYKSIKNSRRMNITTIKNMNITNFQILLNSWQFPRITRSILFGYRSLHSFRVEERHRRSTAFVAARNYVRACDDSDIHERMVQSQNGVWKKPTNRGHSEVGFRGRNASHDARYQRPEFGKVNHQAEKIEDVDRKVFSFIKTFISLVIL